MVDRFRLRGSVLAGLSQFLAFMAPVSAQSLADGPLPADYRELVRLYASGETARALRDRLSVPNDEARKSAQTSRTLGTRVRLREPDFVTSATSSIRTPPIPR